MDFKQFYNYIEFKIDKPMRYKLTAAQGDTDSRRNTFPTKRGYFCSVGDAPTVVVATDQDNYVQHQ